MKIVENWEWTQYAYFFTNMVVASLTIFDNFRLFLTIDDH